MIRRNESLCRLGRPGLAAVLLAAAAALPLTPTLAQVEGPRQEQREITVTRSSSAPGTDNPRIDVVAGPDGTLTVDGGGGSVVIRSEAEDVVETAIDARTGKKVEMRGASMRIVDANEVEQARAEVEKLSAALAQAKQHLKELEKLGKNKQGSADVAPKGMIGEYAVKRSATNRLDGDMKTKLDKSKLDASDSARKARGEIDQQQRLNRLEEKLDKLDQLLNEMREMKERDRRENKNADNTVPK